MAASWTRRQLYWLSAAALAASVKSIELELSNHRFPSIVNLTHVSFDVQVTENAGNIWLVLFHVPWCSHCQRLRPLFSMFSYEAKIQLEGVSYGMVNIPPTYWSIPVPPPSPHSWIDRNGFAHTGWCLFMISRKNVNHPVDKSIPVFPRDAFWFSLGLWSCIRVISLEWIFYYPNKRSFRGPSGVLKGLDLGGQAKICARELAFVAFRGLQGPLANAITTPTITTCHHPPPMINMIWK